MSRDPKDRLVTVCAACKCASCWQGEFYCEDFRDAGIEQIRVGTLEKMGLESPHYWEAEHEE